MIDLRYHVYSLAAVFFALAIGIIIGTSFVGKPADREKLLSVSQRYEHTLGNMQTEMRKQETSLRAARSEASRNDKLATALMPIAFKDRLLYHNVAIIQTGDYDDLATHLKTVIQSVGGQVTNVTKISPSFDFEDPDAVLNVLTKAGITPAKGESGRTAILHMIANALVTGKDNAKLPILEERKVISLSGEYTHWNRYVLIIGGSVGDDNRRAELIDIPLMDEFLAMKSTVVACEPLNATGSYVPIWKRLDLATVDNANTTQGEIAMICALNGETAHFGQKSTADVLMPKTLEAPGE
jgi:phage host-nuclease inhibitor protein Gam